MSSLRGTIGTTISNMKLTLFISRAIACVTIGLMLGMLDVPLFDWHGLVILVAVAVFGTATFFEGVIAADRASNV